MRKLWRTLYAHAHLHLRAPRRIYTTYNMRCILCIFVMNGVQVYRYARNTPGTRILSMDCLGCWFLGRNWRLAELVLANQNQKYFLPVLPDTMASVSQRILNE